MIAVEPLVSTTSIMGVVYQGVLYCFFIAFPLVFEGTYKFTQYQTGLAFLPLFIGSLLGLVCFIVADRLKYRPAVAKTEREGKSVSPERLYPAMMGSVLMPISLFW